MMRCTLLIAVLLVGCGASGPTYNEALQTYTLEKQEADALNKELTSQMLTHMDDTKLFVEAAFARQGQVRNLPPGEAEKLAPTMLKGQELQDFQERERKLLELGGRYEKQFERMKLAKEMKDKLAE